MGPKNDARRRGMPAGEHETSDELGAAFEERLELAAPRRVAQLAQRLGLDLADPLARHREVLADLLEGVLAAFADAEAHLDHLLLARRQRLEDRFRLFAQVQVDHRVRRREDVAVLDEVAKMAVL